MRLYALRGIKGEINCIFAAHKFVKILMYTRIVWLVFALLMCQWMTARKKGGSMDTARVYRNIETLAMKRTSTKFVYGLVLRPVDSVALKEKPRMSWVSTQSYYEFEGKIIRDIKITTIDPFNTVSDTVSARKHIVYQTGNALHVKTMRLTIKNLLLFKKNEPVDALLIKESERLIRSQSYVHDIAIQIVPTGVGADSVDIFIRELDKWSLMPRVYVANTNTTLKLTDKNFAGSGHELQLGYKHLYEGEKMGYSANYFIPNIRNSYINSTLHYELDEYENSNKSAALERPFYSGLARWAGGAQYSTQFVNDSLAIENVGYIGNDKEFDTQDYWFGTALHLYKGNSDYERTTNFIVSARFTHVDYRIRPSEIADPDDVFSNEDIILGSIGVSSRQYIQSKYIYNFGTMEDVPLGVVAGITGGYQYKNDTERLYLGGRLAYGAFKPWGYINVDAEYGSYFKSLNSEQSVWTAEINYFTNILVLGNWKFRQFVRPRCVIGVNRFANESITLNNGDGIRGFNGSTTGTKKLLLSLQTQSYAPWRVMGFRFGPYATCAVGVLGDSESGFSRRKFFSQFGLGCLLKNQFFVIDEFQLSISYYPSIPGVGDDVVKLNAISTNDYEFNNFILGKPSVVEFK